MQLNKNHTHKSFELMMMMAMIHLINVLKITHYIEKSNMAQTLIRVCQVIFSLRRFISWSFIFQFSKIEWIVDNVASHTMLIHRFQ